MFAHRMLPVLSSTAFALGTLCTTPLTAQEKSAEAELPIQRVVMYTSGVGYFERTGKVTDNATIELRFGSRDVNDLLKSLVLEDLNGGQVTTVTYNARNPVNQTLKTFSIDLTAEPTIAHLLRQVRGERVRADQIEGKILGVEQHKQLSDREIISTRDLLNLLTENGLQGVWLDEVSSIKLLDKKLNEELNEALAILAQSRTTDKKTIGLRCTGKGERTLRVGYIQETPVWKTSYRLVLRDDEKPFLQGWAIVENTGDHDWKDVQLSLVSGRPVSFIMDLYQPLYAERPTVEPELYAGLQPQRHGQDLLGERAPGAIGGMGGGLRSGMGGFGGGAMGGFGGGGFGGRRSGDGRGVSSSEDTENDDAATKDGTSKTSLSAVARSAPSTAKAEDVGELFRYSIETPVTLLRQQSAMLPIINESIAGEKVAIFNVETDDRHPLSAYYLENTSKLHLMQGPITIFDGGEYAGDGQIADIDAGEKRLVSYALDLSTEIAVETPEPVRRLTAVKIVRGLLHRKVLAERKAKYRIKNSDKKTKRILIEQPVDQEWKLVSPKEPREKTRSLYRFAVEIKGGEAKELTVVEQHEDESHVTLAALTDEQIEVYRKGDIASEKLKKSLEKLQELRAEFAEATKKTESKEQQLAEISKEQTRIRANMGSLDKSSELYKRYVQTLGSQEDQIQKLQESLKGLREAEAQAGQQLIDFGMSHSEE